MILKEFMKTDTYKFADVVNFISKNGEEIERMTLSVEIISYHLDGGILEIELDME